MAPEPTRAELDEQAKAAGLNPDDYETKADLQEALQEVNPAPEDTETPGRPPLADVAEERVDNRNVRTVRAREEA